MPWNYEYYVPHVLAGFEYYPADDAFTNLWIITTEDQTDYEVDQDADGTFEIQMSGLSAGSENVYLQHTRYGGLLKTGALVRSNKPLQIVLHFVENDYGTMDCAWLFTSIWPVESWGTHFMIPVDSTYAYVFAKESTVVTITPPGLSPFDVSIPARTNFRIVGAESGTKIEAVAPLYVLAVNCQADQNYPWMYNVLPLGSVGSEYYYDASYGPNDVSWPWPSLPQLTITAVNQGTDVSIDEDQNGTPEFDVSLNSGETFIYSFPKEGAHITANNKIYVTYVENWSEAYLGKASGAATELIPVNAYGNKYVLWDMTFRALDEQNPRIFVVSSQDNNLVNVDLGWEGIDQSKIMGKGEVWKIVWPTIPGTHMGLGTTANVWSDKPIQVIYRTDASHDTPGVNIAYTPVPLLVNHPPVARICTIGNQAAGDACVASVGLDGTCSSDPDGDTLTYSWAGDFGTVTGPKPTVELAKGAHLITLTVDDGRGGTATDMAMVTVYDGTPPVIGSLSASPDVLWPPNHKMVPISLQASVSDACDPVPTWRIVSVSSNEPVNGLGDGDTAPDWVITGDFTLDLRAERSGTGNGRTYAITVQAVDASGNHSEKTVTVAVPKSK
jgi:hypothetical protein